MSNRSFSDRLLSAEQTTPAFREKYEREVKAMLLKTLTPAQRFAWWFSTVMSIGLFAGFGYVAVTAAKLPIIVRGAFALGAIAGLAWGIVAGKIARTGVMHRKIHPNVLTGAVWVFMVLFTVVMLLVTAKHPDSVRSVYMLLYALAFYLMGLASLITNRIDQTYIRTEERLLEIELRLAELKESLDGKD